jgi:hypothetical protein
MYAGIDLAIGSFVCGWIAGHNSGRTSSSSYHITRGPNEATSAPRFFVLLFCRENSQIPVTFMFLQFNI